MTGIVVLNYNNEVDIINCIESVFKYTSSETFKMVVVDNGSEEPLRVNVENYLQVTWKDRFEKISYIDEFFSSRHLKTMTYLLLPQNVGYAQGNNAGINLLLSDAEVSEILILNSDIIFVEDILSQLECFLSLENVAAISPLLIKKDGSIDYSCARTALNSSVLSLTFSYLFKTKYEKAIDDRRMLKRDPLLLKKDFIEIDLPSGSCMLFKAEVLKLIGGFDSNTFLYYEEDILNKKIKRHGLINIMIPSLKCVHLGGATTNRTKTSFFLRKCNYESLLYYLREYEKCSIIRLMYFKMTAWMCLMRLWLSMTLRQLFK